MIALLLTLTLAASQPRVQSCGPHGHAGVVIWLGGADSADLSPVGVSQCSQAAWVQTAHHDIEVRIPGEGDAPELYVDGLQRGPDLNCNAGWVEHLKDPHTGRTWSECHPER